MSGSVEERLREYLVSYMGVPTLPGDDDLLAERGFIASVQLLELVDFIEDSFGVVLRPIDVLPENLATIRTIADTVRGRMAGA